MVPAEQARQGVTGHNVRYVLGIGIAAAIVRYPRFTSSILLKNLP